MVKVKKPAELPEIRRRDMVLPVQCGHCIFFRRHAVLEAPCSELGTTASARTCFRFSPDPEQMDDAERLGKALRIISRARRPLLMAAALLTARKVERHGFTIGEVVYFRVAGGDYLCNYASAIVIGATHDRVVLSGLESFSATMYPRMLLNAEGFARKRARLVKGEKINDPEGGFQKLRIGNKDRLLAHLPEIMRAAKKKRGRPPTKTKLSRGPIRIGAGA